MSARFQLYLVILILVGIGGGLTLYKNRQLGFPLLPGKFEPVWTVEAKITFKADGGPAKVDLAIPEGTGSLNIVDENMSSPWYGFTRDKDGIKEYGSWATREATGNQSLFYQVDVIRNRQQEATLESGSPPEPVEPPILKGSNLVAAESLLKLSHTLSADTKSFVGDLLRRLTTDPPLPLVETLLKAPDYKNQRDLLVQDLLALKDIASRPVRGILLGESSRNAKLLTMLEVWDGQEWLVFDLRNGQAWAPRNFLPWQHGEDALLQVTGGRDSGISFSVLRESRSSIKLAKWRGTTQSAALIDFSIYSLPIEIQNIFRLLLLIPVGALVVVVMRNLVGLRTSGTFMPILIALAFMETTLLPGLTIFLLIVSIGLVIRAYLAKLNLLLVPRISAVVIVVIIIMATLSILSFKLGILSGLTITFFPMIILAWTIERMSVLWEEDGPREVLIQGGGSLIVAILAYGAMELELIRHLTFSFPELLLVVLAIILLLGQYTGYRISELQRFSPMIKD